MNNFTYIPPEDYYKLQGPDGCTLEDLRRIARQPTRMCEVCRVEEAWKLAETGMCFSCTTGESDASDDYELIDFVWLDKFLNRPKKGEPMNLQDAYKQGFIDGLKCFAWWKDGAEYLGTTGTILKEAISEVEKMWNYDPPTKED
jgi:hypothetical protein